VDGELGNGGWAAAAADVTMRSEELAASGRRVAAVGDGVRAPARELADAVRTAAGAMPGPRSARAAAELAARWAPVASAWADDLRRFGEALEAAAADLAATDRALAIATPEGP